MYDYVSIFKVQDNLLSDLYDWEAFLGEEGDVLVQLTDENNDLVSKYIGDDLLTSPIHPGIKRVVSRIIPNMSYVGDADELRDVVPVEYVEESKICISHTVSKEQMRVILTEIIDKEFDKIEGDDELEVFNSWSTRWEKGFSNNYNPDELVDGIPSKLVVVQGLDERDNPPIFVEVFILDK